MMKQILMGAAAAVLVMSACQGPMGPTGPQGAAGPAGPQGPGFSTGASISAVSPGQVFLGRGAEVRISGFATEWTDSSALDLGAGITVESVTAASATALVAKVFVTEAAQPGLRDVKVTTGGNTLTFSDGFAVQSPLHMDLTTLPQGGLTAVSIKNLDFGNAFESTNFTGEFADGMFSAGTPSPFSVQALVGADVLAPPGPKDLTITQGSELSPTKFLSPGAVTVTARTPVALDVTGAPMEGSIVNAYDTALYSFTATADSLLTADVTTLGSGDPKILVVPSSGKLNEATVFDYSVSIPMTAGSTYFFIIWDQSGASGFTYRLTASALPMTFSEEAGSNDTSADAQDLVVPSMVTNAVLTDELDQDWYKVTVGPGDVGKSLDIKTTAGDQQTDTVITVYAADGTTELERSDDSNYLDTLTTAPLSAEGVYYIAITASIWGTLPDGKYNLQVSLQ